MADLALTAAEIAVTQPRNSITFEMIAAAAITKGQAVYIDSDGKAAVADGSAAGTADVVGIALNAAAAGEGVTLLKQGFLYGYTITQAYGALIYLSDTAGALADAAGTVSKLVGKVLSIPEAGGNISKVLFVDIVFDA